MKRKEYDEVFRITRMSLVYFIIIAMLTISNSCSHINKPVVVHGTDYVVIKGKKKTENYKIISYSFENKKSNSLIKLKKVLFKNNKVPMYTTVFSIRSPEPIMIKGLSDEYGNKYKTYLYTEKGMYGIEILFNSRFHLLSMDLGSNIIYLYYSNDKLFKFTMPTEYWKEATEYITKKK